MYDVITLKLQNYLSQKVSIELTQKKNKAKHELCEWSTLV